MHYTPTSSSWMNLVERFFGDLTAFITAKSFASTRELADAIITFLAARNDNPQRYLWKAKGEDILRKIDAPPDARSPLALPHATLFTIHQTSGSLLTLVSHAGQRRGWRRADLVQRNGLGLPLASAMKRLMAV